MHSEEAKYYYDLYKLLNDPKFGKFLDTYAKTEFEKHVRANRTRQDEYLYGYNNGSADAWEHVLNLKSRVLDIIRNLGV